MVETLPSKAENVGLIPGQGIKTPHAVRQLNPLLHKRRGMLQQTQCSQKKKKILKFYPDTVFN